MASDITLRWAGPSDATVNTDYKIYADKATSGSFVLVETVNATSPYASYTTTLDGAIDSTTTTVVLDDATNFSATNYAVVDKELIYLGSKSTNTFTSCLRNRGGTLPVAHDDAAVVAKAHESYLDEDVTFNRNVIRYRVIRSETAGDSVAAEFIAVNPTLPPTNNLTRIWLVLDDNGSPITGATVTLQISDSDNFLTDSGELIARKTQSTTTDSDGYAQLLIARNISRNGGDNYVLTVSGTGISDYSRTITTVPDVDHIAVALLT